MKKKLIKASNKEALKFPYNYCLTDVFKDNRLIFDSEDIGVVKIKSIQNRKSRVLSFYKSISRLGL